MQNIGKIRKSEIIKYLKEHVFFIIVRWVPLGVLINELYLKSTNISVLSKLKMLCFSQKNHLLWWLHFDAEQWTNRERPAERARNRQPGDGTCSNAGCGRRTESFTKYVIFTEKLKFWMKFLEVNRKDWEKNTIFVNNYFIFDIKTTKSYEIIIPESERIKKIENYAT